MTDTIVIQQERPDQPDVVAALARLDEYLASLYTAEANYIMDLQALLAPELSFYVARAGFDRGAPVVATGAVRRRPGEAATEGLPYGEIKRMYVDPARRGQGLGARVIQTLEQRLRDDGIVWALLETGAEQTAAVRLYQRCGYALRAPFGSYPDNGLSLFFCKS